MNTREQNRRDYPGLAAIADDFKCMGGRIKHGIENGKEIGKPLEFAGTDVDQYLRMVDADAKRRAK